MSITIGNTVVTPAWTVRNMRLNDKRRIHPFLNKEVDQVLMPALVISHLKQTVSLHYLLALDINPKQSSNMLVIPRDQFLPH